MAFLKIKICTILFKYFLFQKSWSKLTIPMLLIDHWAMSHSNAVKSNVKHCDVEGKNVLIAKIAYNSIKSNIRTTENTFYKPLSIWERYTGSLSKDSLYPSKLGLIRFLSAFNSMEVAIFNWLTEFKRKKKNSSFY